MQSYVDRSEKEQTKSWFGYRRRPALAAGPCFWLAQSFRHKSDQSLEFVASLCARHHSRSPGRQVRPPSHREYTSYELLKASRRRLCDNLDLLISLPSRWLGQGACLWYWLALGPRNVRFTPQLSKAKRQYLLDCNVSRYCLLALHGRPPGDRSLQQKTHPQQHRVHQLSSSSLLSPISQPFCPNPVWW